ncbi:hypothetical protein M422DRAFT_276068 [Sphaerobolus stellatus SS14]|uniref:Uncharacterized protein n=1 Tax=Sphaerobolus stellatus (strain SS14) TaxID=990650 RepID=A0A0C9TND4_SPHS4|nr:hypothetical protein M422DRAFT_276068 [Sphaerobolus stellatus SS14]
MAKSLSIKLDTKEVDYVGSVVFASYVLILVAPAGSLWSMAKMLDVYVLCKVCAPRPSTPQVRTRCKQALEIKGSFGRKGSLHANYFACVGNIGNDKFGMLKYSTRKYIVSSISDKPNRADDVFVNAEPCLVVQILSDSRRTQM